MNILAITYAFVPLQFPATFRLLKWFKYLSEAGHKVTVISVDPDTFDGRKQPELQRFVPKGVDTIQVASLENRLPYRAFGRVRRWWPSLSEPFKRQWYGPAKRALRALPLEQFDLVFSCSQPPVCHLLGYDVKCATGLPWVAYFSDPWVDSPFRTSTPSKVWTYNLKLEQRTVAFADRLVFPSDELRQMVLGKHAPDDLSKAEVLDHCYVPEWFELENIEKPEENGAARVLVTGSFYGPRSALPFLETLAEIDTQVGLAGRVCVDFYGSMSPSDQQHPLWTRVREFARFRGSVGYLASLALMRQSDYLLLIDAPVGDGTQSVFFPSKLAEYLGAGRPIIGITPDKGVSARVLRETGNVVLCPDDKPGLADLFYKMATRSLTGLKTRNSQKYDYRPVGQRLLEIMQSALSGQTPCCHTK